MSVFILQTQNTTEGSIFTLFKNLAGIKQQYGAIKYGRFHITTVNDNLLSYLREYDAQDKWVDYAIVCNSRVNLK